MNILHVATAVFIVGPMAILPMSAMRAIRAGQGGQVTSLAKSTFVFSLLSLVVVFFGFGVAGIYGMSFTTPWILISIVLYLVALALNLALVVPALRRAGAALQDAASEPSGNEYKLIAMGSGIASVLLLVVVILMVWKP